MLASYMLSYDAWRCALLSSSFSPKLYDASHFPLSTILAKLPLLPDDPILAAPGQPALSTPLTPPTPPAPAIDIDLPQPQIAGDSPRLTFKTVPLPPDDNVLKANKQRSRSHTPLAGHSNASNWDGDVQRQGGSYPESSSGVCTAVIDAECMGKFKTRYVPYRR